MAASGAEDHDGTFLWSASKSGFPHECLGGRDPYPRGPISLRG